jgi:hypothetical protein
MACGIDDPLACIPPSPAETVVQSGVDALAKAIADAVASLVRNTVAWWVDVPSIDVSAETSVVNSLRGYLLPVAVFVAVAGVMWAGIRMAFTGKANPLIDVGRGLFAVALWSAIGVALPAAALEGSDALSSWIIDRAAGREFGTRMTAAFTAQIGNPGLVIVVGILAIVAALIQTILMFFREGSVLILTGVVVLAAAGQFNPATRPWLRRVTGWGLALIAYKPTAAMVYATGFTLIGQGRGVRSMFLGFAVLAISILALPALLKFFNWTVGAIGDGGGGGLGAGLAAAGGGLHAASWLGSNGSGDDGHGDRAAQHARFIQQSLGPSNGRPGTPSGSATSGAPAPAASAPAPAATGAGTGATATGGTAATAGATGAGAAGASGAASAGAAGAAGASGAAAAGAAGGPVGVAVAVGAQAAVQGARKAAGKAADATGGAS